MTVQLAVECQCKLTTLAE